MGATPAELLPTRFQSLASQSFSEIWQRQQQPWLSHLHHQRGSIAQLTNHVVVPRRSDACNENVLALEVLWKQRSITSLLFFDAGHRSQILRTNAGSALVDWAMLTTERTLAARPCRPPRTPLQQPCTALQCHPTPATANGHDVQSSQLMRAAQQNEMRHSHIRPLSPQHSAHIQRLLHAPEAHRRDLEPILGQPLHESCAFNHFTLSLGPCREALLTRALFVRSAASKIS
eukprot:1207440-Amphidinium_carterae.2